MTPAVSRPPGLYERLFLESARLLVPFAGFVEITRRCDLACGHCYVEGAKVDLPADRFERALDRMVAAGTFSLSLSGGEPLLHPEFRRMVRAASDRGFMLALFTSATRLTPDLAAFLAGTTLAEVNASVYADDPAIHDAVTRVPGSHAATVAGLRAATAAGLAVAVKCPVLARNHDRVAALAARCAREGWAFKPDPVITPKNSGDPAPLAHRADDRQLAAALAAFPRDRAEVFAPEALVCNAGYNYFGIDADGMLHPCIQMPMPLGAADEIDLAAVWRDAPELARVRAATADRLTACRACSYVAWCDRCPGLALVESGDLSGPSPSACRVAAVRAAARGKEGSER